MNYRQLQFNPAYLIPFEIFNYGYDSWSAAAFVCLLSAKHFMYLQWSIRSLPRRHELSVYPVSLFILVRLRPSSSACHSTSALPLIDECPSVFRHRALSGSV